jgi:hypothetical protein
MVETQSPAIFLNVKRSSAEDAMNDFSPHKLDGARYFPVGDLPDQRWVGLVLGEAETARMQQLLALGEASANEELRDFARRVGTLMGAGLADDEA